MGRYKTLAGNTIVFGVSNFTSKLLVFFMLPFYTTVLSREEYGAADYVITFIGLMIPFFSLSISQGCMRYAMDEKVDKKLVFSFGIRVLVIGTVVLFCLIPLLLQVDVINDNIFVFLILYISHAFQTHLSLFARGINKVFLVGVASVAASFTVVLSNIVLLFILRYGVSGFILSIVISDVIAISILFIGGKMYRFLTFTYDVKLSKEILYYSLPMIPNSLGWWINHSLSRFFLNYYCGIADVGIYSAATKLPNIIDTFRGFFVQAWQLSIISEYDNKESTSFFKNIYDIYNVFVILFCSFIIILSHILATLMFSEEFMEAWSYTPILIVSVMFGSLTTYFGPSYLAHKNTKNLFVSTMLGAFVTIILNISLIPYYGIIGAVVTAAASNLAIYIFIIVDCKKYFPFNVVSYKYIISYIIVIFQAIIITFFKESPIGWISIASLITLILINVHELRFLFESGLKVVKKKTNNKV